MTISLIVPCRNERPHIREFLANVQAFEIPLDTAIEILIADGDSADGTREVLDEYCGTHHSAQIIHNPDRIVSTGLNRALALACGDVIVRLDVHAAYAPDYLVQCLNVLRESGAENVGGPAQTLATGYMQQAIGAAYNSPYACGGARFHDVTYEGFVDTAMFGCWKRETFQRFGNFDETLVRNQDDEHNLRITLGGGRIYQSPRIRSWYKPRATLGALFSQYFQYGLWKVRVIRKHRRPAALRHLVPATFVAALMVLTVAAPFTSVAARLLEGILILYAGFILAASLRICLPGRIRLLPVMPLVLATYHVSYGLGFVAGIASWYRG